MTLKFDALFPKAGSLPALPPLQAFIARDRAVLPYRVYAGPPERAVILLHGSSSHSAYLWPLGRGLAGEATVVTPDLRGHGLAPQRRGDIDYVEQLEDDLADLIAQLRAGGARQIVLGGHSSGGGLALRFGAGRHGAQADAFLLLAPYLGYAAPTVRRGSGGWARAQLAKIAAIALANAVGVTRFNGTPVLRFNLPPAYRTGTETLEYSWRLMTGFNPRNFRSELAAIRKPLCVLVGADDEAFVAGAFEPAIRPWAPHAEVDRISAASHLGLVSSAAAVARAADWLRALARIP